MGCTQKINDSKKLEARCSVGKMRGHPKHWEMQWYGQAEDFKACFTAFTMNKQSFPQDGRGSKGGGWVGLWGGPPPPPRRP